MKLGIPINEHDHAIGPVDSQVTVVNYGDYQCPNCHRRHQAVERLFDQLVDSVRFVYRHFPLVNVHPRALRAATSAEAAAAQGKFWEMHRRLYSQPDKLEERHLRHHAKEIGLDLERFDQEMASGIYNDQVMKNYYQSMIYGITGVPTTFINGELYAMGGVELLETVKTILKDQGTTSL